MIKKIALLGVFLGAFFALGFGFVSAQTGSDMPRQSLMINENGKVSLQGAKVVSIDGSTINATISWGGSASFAGVIKTDASTEFLRRSGGKTSLSEIMPGHYINVEGMLDTSASKPTVVAKVVRDWSVVKTEINPFGVISSVDAVAKTFVLKTQERGDIKVSTNEKTVFTKGNAASTFSALKVRDLLSVNGLWEQSTNTLQANHVKVRVQDRRVFEGGRLKTPYTGSGTPATIIVTFGKIDYTVNISSDTSVLNSKWAKVNLSDFKAGDHVRVYGAADGTTIDATVVRDVSLR
ncbi:MAG: hypothetical protein A3J55_03770 [Candidatus Ryanbacteria bacterium RIFCSPHIGHO2_02_FULL_45_17b]|nr:MAG: hypothetical protein A3J55_03770 [Candidatus Ryanbacteria bacterium RIFCSPHIGHO2_02_FULL_45_17b]